MTWKEHEDGEFYFSFDEGPYAGEILANVYFGVNRIGHNAWCWQASLPSDFLVTELDGWWGSALTELDAREAAEAYLRRHGCFRNPN